MKLLSYALAAIVTASPIFAEDYQRITSKAEYVEQIVGKETCNNSGCATALKSGKMKGKFGSQKFVGAWEWRGNFLCRAGKLGNRDLGTDCQVVEISGKDVRITRNKGKGDVVVYSMK